MLTEEDEARDDCDDARVSDRRFLASLRGVVSSSSWSDFLLVSRCLGPGGAGRFCLPSPEAEKSKLNFLKTRFVCGLTS